MSNEMVDVLNLETGKRGRIRRNLFENAVFNNGVLEEVEPEQKPYVSELFKSRKGKDVADKAEAPKDEAEEDN